MNATSEWDRLTYDCHQKYIGYIDRQIDTVAVASVSSVASSTLALVVLAVQGDTLGRGVTVMVTSITRVHQLGTSGLNWADRERSQLQGHPRDACSAQYLQKV